MYNVRQKHLFSKHCDFYVFILLLVKLRVPRVGQLLLNIFSFVFIDLFFDSHMLSTLEKKIAQAFRLMLGTGEHPALRSVKSLIPESCL